MEATVTGMSFLVVVGNGGSTKGVKMALLTFPFFPRNLWAIIHKLLTITVLKVKQSDYFSLGEGSFRSRLIMFT